MKNGFVLPFGDARMAADMASLAEQHGWDGFFVWEPVWGNDAWVMLTAAAMCTQRIRLGAAADPYLRERLHDLEDLSNRLIRIVSGQSGTAAEQGLSGPSILIARNLGPAELLEYDRRHIRRRIDTLEEKLAHGGNPILRWMMDNIYIRTDPAGNIKADKEKSTEKIDGAVATIMALDRAIRCGNDTGESVYDKRGLLIW